MKKIILTAAIGMSSMAFAQGTANDNTFGGNPFDQSAVISEKKSNNGNGNGNAFGNRVGGDIGAAEDTSNQCLNHKRQLNDNNSGHYFGDGHCNDEVIVPINGIIPALLLSALALMVAFRRRIAEMVA